MIGVDVSLKCRDELKPEFLNKCGIATRLLEHRVDQHRLLCPAIAQQVGVGRGLRIEQLSEDKHRLSLVRTGGSGLPG